MFICEYIAVDLYRYDLKSKKTIFFGVENMVLAGLRIRLLVSSQSDRLAER
jgi:hypothetical protein